MTFLVFTFKMSNSDEHWCGKSINLKKKKKKKKKKIKKVGSTDESRLAELMKHHKNCF